MSAPASLGDLLSAYCSAVAIHDQAFGAQDEEGAATSLDGIEAALLAIFAPHPAGELDARLWRHIILTEGLTYMSGDEHSSHGRLSAFSAMGSQHDPVARVHIMGPGLSVPALELAGRSCSRQDGLRHRAGGEGIPPFPAPRQQS